VKRELLFSVTKKDLDITWFSGCGAGGQHRNKHQNCIRIQHRASGTLVTGQSHKERQSNIKEALKNLTSNPKFKVWLSRMIYEVLGGKTLDERVNEMMEPNHIKVETRNESGNWESA